jgi:hypothetical protein
MNIHIYSYIWADIWPSFNHYSCNDFRSCFIFFTFSGTPGTICSFLRIFVWPCIRRVCEFLCLNEKAFLCTYLLLGCLLLACSLNICLAPLQAAFGDFDFDFGNDIFPLLPVFATVAVGYLYSRVCTIFCMEPTSVSPSSRLSLPVCFHIQRFNGQFADRCSRVNLRAHPGGKGF